RRGNPLMEAILDAGLPYVSGPQWLGEAMLQGRHVLAVAGTHGKTTTTAMLTHVLEQCDMAPDFLIGGVAEDFGVSARYTGSRHFVIEADEYDTAFFDKRSKFVHYQIGEAMLQGRHVLAVAGTHGKTTTTAMLTHVLEQCDMAPDFLIGGVAEDFGVSARYTGSRHFVIEADEYDTAFFDKRSKFVHY